ncbi:MAG: hypothetical protein PHQ19_02340 [Candidatus Krumholzibacteria bacterium]|nr:hypothetical protein [Candidatus Krumholzibacteria bacterium]
MKLLFISLLILGFSFPFAAGSVAGEIDECWSELSVSCEGMRISICPRRDFEYIGEGCGGTDDYIEIWVRDAGGYGVAGIPETDYCLFACDANEELSICYFFITADSVTSAMEAFRGRTTFSRSRIAGGGCALNGVCMAVQGKVVLDEECIHPICLDIEIVSPDINGDLDVDLSDLSFFGEAYNTQEGEPGYSACCDYNDDGVCDLSDFAFFGQHYTHQCL